MFRSWFTPPCEIAGNQIAITLYIDGGNINLIGQENELRCRERRLGEGDRGRARDAQDSTFWLSARKVIFQRPLLSMYMASIATSNNSHSPIWRASSEESCTRSLNSLAGKTVEFTISPSNPPPRIQTWHRQTPKQSCRVGMWARYDQDVSTGVVQVQKTNQHPMETLQPPAIRPHTCENDGHSAPECSPRFQDWEINPNRTHTSV